MRAHAASPPGACLVSHFAKSLGHNGKKQKNQAWGPINAWTTLRSACGCTLVSTAEIQGDWHERSYMLSAVDTNVQPQALRNVVQALIGPQA